MLRAKKHRDYRGESVIKRDLFLARCCLTKCIIVQLHNCKVGYRVVSWDYVINFRANNRNNLFYHLFNCPATSRVKRSTFTDSRDSVSSLSRTFRTSDENTNYSQKRFRREIIKAHSSRTIYILVSIQKPFDALPLEGLRGARTSSTAT